MSPVVLQPDFSNAQQFINGLYDPRDYSAVQSAVPNGELEATIADPTSRGVILNSWLQAWKYAADNASADPIQSTDQALILFLADYIKETGLYFAAPQLTRVGSTSEGHLSKKHDVPVYANAGYQLLSFFHQGDWVFGSFDEQGVVSSAAPEGCVSVAEFLALLYCGAHCVVINSIEDSTHPAPNFQDKMCTFADNHGIAVSHDPGNSHYTRTVNTSGKYWLKVSGDSVPADNPMLLAFLTGLTAHSDDNPNCFFQLEGWPANADLSRHKKDYDANKDSDWNFSTFGACVYSEKREAPLFLCPNDFDLSLNSQSKMPVYQGAQPVQHWMNPELMEIPS